MSTATTFYGKVALNDVEISGYPKEQETTGAIISNRDDLVRGVNAICLSSRDLDSKIATGLQSSIVGGFNNIVAANNGCIVGGADGSVLDTSINAGIIGGLSNTIHNESDSSFIGGGDTNAISLGIQCAILGGHDSVITGTSTVDVVSGAVICGGFDNQMLQNCDESIVVSGRGARLTNSRYSIIGGFNNILTDSDNCFINGRLNNINNCDDTSVGGFSCTSTNAHHSAIKTGENNIRHIYIKNK
jgi:hypothetical protein